MSEPVEGGWATVEVLFASVNGKRRSFLLRVEDVRATAEEALASPIGIAVRHGGAERASMTKTSLCLGVRTPDGAAVVVGLGAAWADRPSPGRVWKELGPWQQHLERNVAKAQAWARERAADRVRLPASALARAAAPKPQGMDGAALLRAVLERPEDDGARAVYADHLSSIGDPRGELIALQLASPAGRAEKGARDKRIAELVKKHGKAWTRDAAQVALESELSRGFVGTIRATANAFAANGAALFAREPLEHLVVSSPTAAGLRLLAAAPHLARLRALSFSSPLWLRSARDLDALRALLGSPHAAGVRALSLQIEMAAPVPGVATALEGLALPALRSLALRWPGAPEALDAVASMRLPALAQLVVHPRKKPQLAALAAAFPKAAVGSKFEHPILRPWR